MPLIRRCRIALAFEHMSQMSTTVAAHNLCARHAECPVLMPRHGAWDGIEECWPATARLELVVCLVQWC